jgi:hypothetical protein
MKKLIMAAAALTALATAAPALAQPWDYDRDDRRYDRGNGRGYDGPGFRDEIARANQMIERGARNGVLSGYEVRGYRANLRDIQYRIDRYRADGMFDRRERADVDQRFDRLFSLIQQSRGDARERRYDDYGSGYGRGW